MDGPYYEILEIRGENELLVYAEDDLSSFVDSDLVGVHELSRLQIEGGALVNFGWDRPLVPGGNAIVVGSDITELEAGSFFGWENADWPPGFNLLLNGNSAAYEWLATNMNWNLTVNGDLDVAWDMAIHSVDSDVLIEAQAIRVGGDADFSGVVPDGFVTVIAPVLEVAGALSIGEGSEYLTEKRDLADDFEDGNIDDWATGGNALWYATTDAVYGGSYSAGSGDIGNYGQSYISRIVETSGTLTFWWKVSSESNYDYLRFYINGSEKSRISGSTSWQQKTYSVVAGDEIKWNYTKDGSVTRYSDKGWIDDVKLE